ncbi:glutamate-5-semialdehyde dehydrogenase [Alkaliphilus oremlandii]|uniref:Gamma-glutamyl phosphate reductase n=1 Tax=Alkaliphilus oremlandii (strain OhILAs) TaxID=350688 RepID=PROA_ALKOO|nr:glutamate-5-semialdehyde dehydrogenase [Alkaliphilus oremlandii]A8MFQ5.1 RecName: Full=Gamma-glutamyl phosphate reductase; Short=GPR; AltName: Full=Glutamate-5-semialdehyde dehydrogenase; AltName: Full=Glutamyl-gamma-semialdehyde dehydrogenase; Short=GSA dehydrogenase [Alkaliphilus oremlandii OhILAs]ABW17694.1 gamma-glutamyl phosphate reductase [Alkaliphilus oremlandii OhILAs]
MSYLIEQCKRLKEASYALGMISTKDKDEALRLIIDSIKRNKDDILAENDKDVLAAKEKGTKDSLIDRLKLTEDRIQGILEGIETIIGLKDPIWRSNDVWTLENGLTISKMTVPLGVIGIIYESRPNVTVDAFSLALKSGNCILLRGSSSAIHSNKMIVSAIKEGLRRSKVSEDIIELIEDTDRNVVKEMLTLNEYIDVIIPRGGADLIRFVVDHATVPTIETGIGNCHIYVDESANLENAIQIITNAKIQRPGVCNACETTLIHEDIAPKFLPMLAAALKDKVELKGCPRTREIIQAAEATDMDWAEEYLDYILAVKVVSNVDEAIGHIQAYGTKHSEAIITENYTNANYFLRRVDAAAVYVNASTRFTDGGAFGFGGEMGISTQKTHARGPMGLNELVTMKYTVVGNGQIRQ